MTYMIGKIRFDIDWSLPRDAFREQIVQMVKTCQEQGKTIPLPAAPNPTFGVTLLAGLNCGTCNKCCEQGEINLTPTELANLKDRCGEEGFTPDGIKAPCRFLRFGVCTIYERRPLVCITYPLQAVSHSPGADLLTVDSSCPATAPLAIRAYMFAWDMTNKRKEIQKDAEAILKNQCEDSGYM